MAEIPIIKPSWQTSEFWLTVLNQVIAAILMLSTYFGLKFSQTDADMLNTQFGQLIPAVVAAVVSGWTLIRYMQGRVDLKKHNATNSIEAAKEDKITTK